MLAVSALYEADARSKQVKEAPSSQAELEAG
jgi:hypothetical protein